MSLFCVHLGILKMLPLHISRLSFACLLYGISVMKFVHSVLILSFIIIYFYVSPLHISHRGKDRDKGNLGKLCLALCNPPPTIHALVIFAFKNVSFWLYNP